MSSRIAIIATGLAVLAYYVSSKKKPSPFARPESVGVAIDIKSPNDDTADPAYDFVIVGGGTAAMVLASRLTERNDFSVLVLEAGHR